MSQFDEDAYNWDPEFDDEDDIVARHRNWPIYEDVGGQLYITINGDERYCTSIEDAKKEIDKSIKAWGKRRALGLE